MDRYCFERERIARSREEGVDPPMVYDGVYLTKPYGGGYPSRSIYVVYDRHRGLYESVCYTSNADDAQRIVDALNGE